MENALSRICFRKITGETTSLQEYIGNVLLVVNVASNCGLAQQYDGLRKLFSQYRERGFYVLGFPSNEFDAQEPGGNAEIQNFCRLNKIEFPMFEKIVVKGERQHPLYAFLTKVMPYAQRRPGSDLEKMLKERGLYPRSFGEILWNFEKFLIDRDGLAIDRFAPDIELDDSVLLQAIERELSRPKSMRSERLIMRQK